MEGDLRIPLSIIDTFFVFSTIKPSRDTMLNGNNSYLLAPTECDVHSYKYGHNEVSLLDWKMEMVENKCKKKLFLSDACGSIN